MPPFAIAFGHANKGMPKGNSKRHAQRHYQKAGPKALTKGMPKGIDKRHAERHEEKACPNALTKRMPKGMPTESFPFLPFELAGGGEDIIFMFWTLVTKLLLMPSGMPFVNTCGHAFVTAFGHAFCQCL